MATFRGISFIEEDDGPAVPGREEDVTPTHIPGGNVTVIQSSGNLIQTFECKAVVSRSALNSMVGFVGSSGSLVTYHATRSARLSKVAPAERIGANDKFRTSLFFYLL
jgi:hypothetical protein